MDVIDGRGQGAVEAGYEELRETVRQLAVPLADGELLRLGSDLASVNQEIETHAAKEKDVKSQLKAERDSLESRRTKISALVRAREERREVRCSVRFLDSEQVQVVRLDTDEVVETRQPTAGELQREIEDVAGADEEA